MNNNKIFGLLKISSNGLCNFYKKLDHSNKNFDPQIISGFFYAVDKFIQDFIGENIVEIKTLNYKIIFKKFNDEINVYFVNNDFTDYSQLNNKIFDSPNYLLSNIIAI
ncbi:MAG: hypothetical protein ACTSWR_04725 [Candidatus Helarchaeota archaeon]